MRQAMTAVKTTKQDLTISRQYHVDGFKPRRMPIPSNMSTAQKILCQWLHDKNERKLEETQ
jgi:hypothetical protein